MTEKELPTQNCIKSDTENTIKKDDKVIFESEIDVVVTDSNREFKRDFEPSMKRISRLSIFRSRFNESSSQNIFVSQKEFIENIKKNSMNIDKHKKPKKIDPKIFENLLIFIKCYLLPHIFASSSTILVLFIQSKYGKGCFLPPNCLCDNQIIYKIYDAFKDIVYFYVFLILTCVSNDFIETKKAKIYIFLSCSLFLLFYYIIMDENFLIDIYIYLFMMFLKIGTEIYFLKKRKKNDIFKTVLKLNIVYIVIYVNYLFFSLCLINMKLLLTSIDKDYGKLAQFLISCYTITLTYILEKVHLIYADMIFTRNQENKMAIFLSSFMMLSYVFGISVSNIIHMNMENIESFFWVTSYLNVLTTSFLSVNVVRYSFWKVKNIIVEKCSKKDKIKVEPKKLQNLKKIRNMVAETSLDMLFITSIRPIILFLSGKWLAKYGNAKLFKNCEYDYDENYFFIDISGLIAIIFMNFFITFLICLYSSLKKQKIIYYRDNFKIFNLYILFLMHFFYEATLTVFY